MFGGLCLCVLLLAVKVGACLGVCVLGTGMGIGSLDGDGIEAGGGAEGWGMRKTAVREEARA